MMSLTDTLLHRVADAISRYSMASAGDRIGVAVSGGADSVVLLHALHRLSPLLKIDLTVLHLNHQLRAGDSDADQAFVEALAASLGLPVVCESCDVSAMASAAHGNLEETARDARRSFFHRQILEGVVRRIATGHTESDQAETVLFRLFRGAGLAGFAGMRPATSDGLIRPLLFCSRGEVRQWAATNELTWREDSSNADPRFRRNQLRNEFLPRLREQFNPNLESVLAGVAQVAQAEEDYWSEAIEPLFRAFAKRTHFGLLCDVPFLTNQHLAVQRRLLRRALAEVRGDLRGLDRLHVQAVLDLCGAVDGHQRVIIPGIDALRSFATLRLAPPSRPEDRQRYYRVPLPPGQTVDLPFHAGRLRIDLLAGNGSDLKYCANFKDDSEFVEESVLQLKLLGGAADSEDFVVRNWEPGDGYQRLGHLGSEKIKRLFQEEKVLLWERRHWPVATHREEIVWARRFGVAARWAGNGEAPGLLLRYAPADESNGPVVTS